MKLLATKPYSSNPGDDYLSIVLYLVDGQYVTWMLNSFFGPSAHSSGHYFTNLKEALADFNRRGEE